MNSSLRALGVILGLLAGGAASSIELHQNRRFEAGYAKREPQPQPVERAKACENYGQGFRAMPGTSSCLKVFGGVRMEFGSGRGVR